MNNRLSENKAVERLVILLYIVMTVVAVTILVRAVKRFLLPFVLAWMLALLLQPLAELIGRRFKGSRKIISAALVLVIFALSFLLAIYVMTRLLGEITGIAAQLRENAGTVSEGVVDFIEKIKSTLKLGGGKEGDYLYGVLEDSFKNAVVSLSAKITSSAAGIISDIPGMLLTLFIFIFSSFYICSDFDGINSYIASLLPRVVVRKLGKIKSVTVKGAAKFIRAYMTLFLMTFAELYFAFSVLRIRYSLALAVIISLVDILPAVGTGIVLLPWAGIEFVIGNKTLALSLIVVYIAVTVIRQIAEPHVIGSSLGIHPLAALISVYVGFRAAGALGLIIAPLAALLGKQLFEALRRQGENGDAP